MEGTCQLRFAPKVPNVISQRVRQLKHMAFGDRLRLRLRPRLPIAYALVWTLMIWRDTRDVRYRQYKLPGRSQRGHQGGPTRGLQ